MFPSLTKATSETRKTARVLFSIVALLAGIVTTARAQSALDGFDPNANGAVRIVVVQPDGRILIGGDFTTLAPNGGVTVTRNHIARLNPDGTLDTAFNPSATGVNPTIRAIAVQTDGKVLVGGDFNNVGGQTRHNIARLDATTGAPDSFDPNASGSVFAIAVQTDGKILAGGFFNSIGGQMRNRIARLDPTSGLAESFDAALTGPEVFAIALQADGKILVGGFFTSIGGQTRNNIARLDPTTVLADSFNPDASDEVRCLAVQADGKVLAGGFFTIIGGQNRNSIARLDATTGAADSFNPNPNNGVFVITVQPDGKILVGGDFFNISGQSRHLIARLNPTGLADSFDPSANSTVNTIVVQADGKILAGGGFSILSPNGGATVTRNHIARLESDGRVDQTIDLNVVGLLTSYVNTIAIQRDGKFLIGGNFTTVLGAPRGNIARLNADGTLDAAFNPNASSEVDAIAVQADGKILVGGFFNGSNSIGGQSRNYITRLDAVTGLADSFNPNANNIVRSIGVQPDGKVVVGGYFTTIGGQTRNRIARLEATGLADSFDPNANGTVFSLAVQTDGKILAAGDFNGANSIGGQTRNRIARLDGISGLADSLDANANGTVFSVAVQADGKVLAGGSFSGANSIGGQTRNRIARLDTTTGSADSFDPNANGSVSSIALQADGKVLAGGSFSGTNCIGGQTRNRIARLDATTGLADSLDPNANNLVFSIAVQADGKILAGGVFSGANSIGGQARNYFARLSNDTPALQNLRVFNQGAIWTLGGSSPQFTRVTFEYSTDNVTYTLFGNGISNGSEWRIFALSFPTGQNFYIRARGYYRSGTYNGSESVMESVRNAFLPPPPTPLQIVSRKIHGDAGAFGIILPLTGSPGIECRSGGATNDYQVVFSFANAVTFNHAAITSGTGSVSNSSGSGTAAITVNLTGVTNAQTITVTLQGASDGGGRHANGSTSDVSVEMAVLIGDTSGNGSVNGTDVTQTKANSGLAVDASNFRADVNASGSINATDIGLVKSMSGTALPSGNEATVLSKGGLFSSPHR